MENPDFTKLEDLQWPDKVDPSFIAQHFTFLGEIMTWFVAEGREILERREALNYNEWGKLFNRAFFLWHECLRIRTVNILFELVVERGISSLIDFAQANGDEQVVTE